MIQKIKNYLKLNQTNDHTNINYNMQNMIDNCAIREFNHFWDKLEFDFNYNIKIEYYKKFRNKQYNYISILPYINENILKNEINMFSNHCKYFLNQIKLWKCNCCVFETWLKQKGMYCLYFKQFEKYSVYTFDSLKRIVRNDKNILKTFLLSKGNENDANSLKYVNAMWEMLNE